MKTKLIYEFTGEHVESDEYDFSCITKAKDLNIAVYDCLQIIRSRLKYEEGQSDREIEVLEELRTKLYEFYTEG